MLRQLRPWAGGRSVYLGFIASDGDPIKDFADEARRIEALRRYGDEHSADLSDEELSTINNIKEHALKIGEPLIMAHSRRSRLAMQGREGMDHLFEQELLENIGVWRERLGLLLFGPAAVFASGIVLLAAMAAYGIAKLTGFKGAVNDFSALVFHFFEPILKTFTIIDTLILISFPAAALAVSLFGANHFLPPCLRIEQPYLVRRFLELFSPWKPDQAHSDRTNRTKSAKRAWARWVRRRVFGGISKPSIVIIGIKDADFWSRQDIESLRDVVAMRRPGQSLLLLCQVRGRTAVSSGFLAPWTEQTDTESSPKLNFEAFDDVGLWHCDDEQDLDLNHRSQSSADLDELLGWRSARDASRSDWCGALVDDQWSAHDLLPMVILGSNDRVRFTVSKRRTDDFTQYGRQFAEDLRRFRNLFDGDSSYDFDLAGSASIINTVFEQAEEAKGALFFAPRGHRTVHIAGRSAFRQDLVQELRPHFEALGESVEIYAAKMTACGELYNLGAASAVAVGGASANDTGHLVQQMALISHHIMAAAKLLSERRPFDLGEPRHKILSRSWEELASKIGAIEVPDDPPCRRAAARLQAALQWGISEKGPLPNSHAGSLSEIDFADIETRYFPGNTPAGCLEAEIKTTLVKLRSLDGSFAKHILERRMVGEWSEFPNWLKGRIFDAQAQAGNERTLADLILSCRTADQIITLIENHREISHRAIATVCILALRELRHEFQNNDLDEISRAQQYRALAEGLDRLRKVSGDVPVASLDPMKFSIPPDQRSRTAWGFCLDDTMPDKLSAILVRQPEETGVELAGVVLGTFDALNKRIERIVTLEFEKS